VKNRTLRYFGHVMMHSCLKKNFIEWTLPGSRKRGRPKTSWLGNITEWTNVNLDTDNENSGQKNRMENNDLSCGQPSDRGWEGEFKKSICIASAGQCNTGRPKKRLIRVTGALSYGCALFISNIVHHNYKFNHNTVKHTTSIVILSI